MLIPLIAVGLLIAGSARAQIAADTKISRIEGPGSLTLRATQPGAPQAPQQNEDIQPTLVVTKTAVPATPEIGGTIRYTFAVTNVGSIPGTNVLIEDPHIVAAVKAGLLAFSGLDFVQLPTDAYGTATIFDAYDPGPPPEAAFGGVIEHLSPGSTFAFFLEVRVLGFGPTQTFTNVATAKNCGPLDDDLTTGNTVPCQQQPVIAESEPVTVRFRVASPAMGLGAAAVVALGLSVVGMRRVRRQVRH